MEPWETKRAKRRGDALRMKSRALRTMRLWGIGTTAARHYISPDPRDLGVNISTHCRRCACWMCQADPKEVPPRRERSFADLPEPLA